MRLIVVDVETTGFSNQLSTTNLSNSNLKFSNSFPVGPGGKIKFTCHGEVIQFSALVLDEDTLMPTELISFFCMPTEPISDEASRVHGITNDMIYDLSGGKYLEDYLFNSRDNGGFEDIFNSTGNLFMTYNAEFDTKAINRTLEGYSLELDFGVRVKSFIDFDESKNYNLCLMKSFSSLYGFSRFVKLEDALKIANFDQMEFTYKKIMAMFNKVSSANYHNADYDTVAAWVLFYLMRSRL